MRIGICDDTHEKAESTRKFLSQYIEDPELDFDIYLPEEAVIDLDERSFCCDIFVTELVFPTSEYNGLQLAKHVKEEVPSCRIIFYAEYVPDVDDIYEVEHNYLVLKRDRDKRLIKAVEKVLGSFNKKQPNDIRIDCGRSVRVFSCDEIYYIRREDRMTCFVTSRGEFRLYMSLRQLMEKLPDSFVRFNSSTIVNRNYICEYQKNLIILFNGEQIKIGRTYKKTY